MAATPADTSYLPTVADVSLLLRTRTVAVDSNNQGFLGGDTGPDEVTIFDDTTRPTDIEVENTVVQVAPGVLAQLPLLPLVLPDNISGVLRYVIALYAAIQIEVSFFRENTNQDLINLWRDLADRTTKGLKDQLAEGGVSKRFGTMRIGTIHNEYPLELALDSLPYGGWWDLSQAPWTTPWPPGIPGTVPRQGANIG